MKLSAEHPNIVVVGSSSIDLVLNTEHHPAPNETVMALKSETFFGGKGANQAVGTSRLGANVYFVGSVGLDPYGQQILKNLIEEKVNVGFVHEDSERATGTAYITSADGKNAIVVMPSANYGLRPKHIDNAEKFFVTADLVLTQLEIPMDVVQSVYEKCKKLGKKLGIYASPATKIPGEILEYASFIVAKSNELSIIFDDESREKILRKYPNKLFVRDDTNSTIYYNGSEMKFYRNDPEEMHNKMGMGDAFTSGFAVAYCHGNTIDDCVNFGNEVSLKVSKKTGSQTGLPHLSDFQF